MRKIRPRYPNYRSKIAYLDSTEGTTTHPMMRLTLPYLQEEGSRLFRAADIIPLVDIVDTLTSQGFLSYMGGSAIYNAVFHGRREYNDLDILAIYSDKQDQSFFEKLKRNAIPFSRDLRDFRIPKKEKSRNRKSHKIRPIKIGETKFLIKDLHDPWGGYLSGPASDRFALRPLFSGSQKKLGKPVDIDLSFRYHLGNGQDAVSIGY